MDDHHHEPMIAALLRIPYQEVVAHVSHQITAEFPDLRPAHMIVFQLIQHPPAGSRLTELAALAHVTVQSMGELIDALEKRHYVERIPDPADRRAKLICLTDRGWAALVRGREIVGAVQTAWAERLGDTKFEQLLALLRELNQGLA